MFERLPLKDIHLPDPVSWWPPAPGWWLLPLALALAWLILRGGAGWLGRAARRRRLRRRAMAELDRIARRYRETGDAREAAESVSVLLRRVAVTIFPRRRVAGLAGRDWAGWLLETGPPDLAPAAASSLADAPYHPAPAVDAPALVEAARRWVGHVVARQEPPS